MLNDCAANNKWPELTECGYVELQAIRCTPKNKAQTYWKCWSSSYPAAKSQSIHKAILNVNAIIEISKCVTLKIKSWKNLFREVCLQNFSGYTISLNFC